MDEVYLNGFCNIASSLSTIPEEGLFWDRNPTLGGVFTVQFHPHHYASKFDVFWDQQELIRDRAPLYRRGWVIQESNLSPRTMHFSRFPAFECRESFACESYRTTESGLIFPDETWFTYSRKSIFGRDSFGYAEWCVIVYDYSRCQLTIHTDKLIALCGIAKALSSVIPGPYYGAIWLQWWLQGLLWMVDQWLSGLEMSPIRSNNEYIGKSIVYVSVLNSEC
jgi:hypothetical protein